MTEQVIDWETFKEKGNEAYKKKNYDEAIRHYSDAISKLYIKIQCATQIKIHSTQIEHFAIFHKNDIVSLFPI